MSSKLHTFYTRIISWQKAIDIKPILIKVATEWELMLYEELRVLSLNWLSKVNQDLLSKVSRLIVLEGVIRLVQSQDNI